MPYNPAGLFSLVASYLAQPGTAIRTEQHNPVFEDVAGALSSVLLRDGRAPMTGALNMNSFPINGVDAGDTPGSVATVAQLVPIGAVMDFAGPTAPEGWMLCAGQAISRTTYATLFTLIGTTYGAGDSSTTFNLPDLRGRVAAAPDAMGGTAANRLSAAGLGAAAVLGGVGGAQSQTLTAAQIPTITSVQNQGFNVAVSGNISGFTNETVLISGPGNASQTGTSGFGGQASISGSFSGGGTVPAGNVTTTSNNTGGQAHPNVQPTIILNKIIRVSFDG